MQPLLLALQDPAHLVAAHVPGVRVQGAHLLSDLLVPQAPVGQAVDRADHALLVLHGHQARAAVRTVALLDLLKAVGHAPADAVAPGGPVHLPVGEAVLDDPVLQLGHGGQHHEHDLVGHLVHVELRTQALGPARARVDDGHVPELLAEEQGHVALLEIGDDLQQVLGRAREAVEAGADHDVPVLDGLRELIRPRAIEDINLPRVALVEVEAVDLPVVLLAHELLDVALLELDADPVLGLLHRRDPAVAVDLIDALPRLDHFTPPRYP